MPSTPECIYCHRPVRDYRSLKHSVKWDGGQKAGQYAHSKCFYSSGDLFNEVQRAFQPMVNAISELTKKGGE